MINDVNNSDPRLVLASISTARDVKRADLYVRAREMDESEWPRAVECGGAFSSM